MLFHYLFHINLIQIAYYLKSFLRIILNLYNTLQKNVENNKVLISYFKETKIMKKNNLLIHNNLVRPIF